MFDRSVIFYDERTEGYDIHGLLLPYDIEPDDEMVTPETDFGDLDRPVFIRLGLKNQKRIGYGVIVKYELGLYIYATLTEPFVKGEYEWRAGCNINEVVDGKVVRFPIRSGILIPKT